MSTEKRCLPPFLLPVFSESIGRCSPSAFSGMEVSEWMAIEDGCVPQDINRLRAMAETMQISFDKIATLVLVCRAAWEV